MKVQIWKDYAFGGTKISFYEVYDRKVIVYNLFTNEKKELNDDEQCPENFMLHLHYGMDQEVFKALAEALDEQGIKTDKDAKIKGTLEATRFHLEDLRKLLKLK